MPTADAPHAATRRVRPWLTLRGRLLLMLLVPLVLLAVVGATLDYRTARQLTDESYDRALANIAIGLAARVETDRDGDLPTHLVATVRTLGRLTDERDLHYLVLDGQGRRLSGDMALGALVASGTDNPQLQDALLDGRPVRAATYRYEGPDGRAVIVVTESLARRSAPLRRVLVQTLTTNLAMAAAGVVLSVLAVGVALRPLERLGRRVQSVARSDRVDAGGLGEFLPIALRGVPAETRPLIRAINRLMARVRRTTQARLAFTNNTAHQLRTPLAGLQAQVGLLATEPLPPSARARVAEVQASVHRLSHLTQQMLSLARAAERPPGAEAAERVSLPALLEDAASSCIDAAVARDDDLGFDAAPAVVGGSAWMLRELLLNLVHNAIEHTPHGTTINVRCGTGPDERAFLEVEDDGPGIAAEARERVFERFVRLSVDDRRGTGLGLAIVREVAQRHGASVRVLDATGGRGTRVRVDFDVAR
ncbi:MAG: sensor histidine kinase [Rubrivivax sp.]